MSIAYRGLIDSTSIDGITFALNDYAGTGVLGFNANALVSTTVGIGLLCTYSSTTDTNTLRLNASTDLVVEGASNLYYTDSRARAAITGTLPISVTSGVVSLGYNSANLKVTANQLNTIQNIDTSASPTFTGLTIGSLTGVLKASAGVLSGSATTADLTEGSNLYYTNARARASISSAGNPLAYNSGTGVFTFQYNTTSLKLTGGALNTIQDLATTSYVTFSQVTSTFVGNLTGNVTGNSTTATSATNATNATYATALSTTGAAGTFWSNNNTWAAPTYNNVQITGRFGVNAIGPGATCNITGETNNGLEAQTLYVAGNPLRNATFTGNYNSIATYFNAGNSATGAFYNYYGLNIGANAGASARIANSFGAYIANPNMSTTGYNLALYADDITIGTVSGKITGGFYCHGSTQIRTQQSLGTTAPQTNTRLYISAGGIATENFTIQSNAYPVRSTGASSYSNITAYANWVSLSGGTMNYYAIDTGQTSGSSPYIGVAFGLYARNPGASATPANNIAIYADDISVGNTTNKIANGIYCSSHLKCGGDLYNGTYSTSKQFYQSTNLVSFTTQYSGNVNGTATGRFIRNGNMVSAYIQPFTISNSVTSVVILFFPTGYTSTLTQSVPIWCDGGSGSVVMCNAWIGGVMPFPGSVGAILTLGAASNFPVGTWSLLPYSIVLNYQLF